MKNENQMEMQIHTTQTNSHMHAMGGKLHIPHILNHISTHTHHPHPPFFRPAAIAHPAKRAHLNFVSVSAFHQLRVKSV